MLEYAFRRVLWVIPVIVSVAAVTFFLMYRAPGGPWDREKTLPAATVKALDAKFGLDKPLWVNPEAAKLALSEGVRNPVTLAAAFIDSRFLNYMTGVFRFDLGPSYASKGAETVQELIARKFPVSLKLGLVAIIFSISIGVPLGVIAALRQNTWLDYLSLGTSTIGVSVPTFVSGLLLLLFLSRTFSTSPIRDPEEWVGFGPAYFLPGIVLGLGTMAYIARLTRTSMLEIKRQDYVRTARAKGLGQSECRQRAHAAQRADPDRHHPGTGCRRPRHRLDHHRVNLWRSWPRPRVRRVDLETRLLRHHGHRDLLRRARRGR